MNRLVSYHIVLSTQDTYSECVTIYALLRYKRQADQNLTIFGV
jgi:hypothetical protein